MTPANATRRVILVLSQRPPHLCSDINLLPILVSSYTTMADVEMKPADEKKEEKKEEKTTEEEKKPVPLTPVAEIKANILLIERAVSTMEPRFTHRVLRSLTHLRRKLDDKVLRDVIQGIYTTGAQQHCSSCIIDL